VNRQEFCAAAGRIGIRRSTFCLDGGLPPEKYVLSEDPDGWSIYYSERGFRQGELGFTSEAEALDMLLIWLVKDPTTRERTT
jgi:hypothetical protein